MRIAALLLFVMSWLGLWVAAGPELSLAWRARHWVAGEATLIKVTPALQSPSGQTEVVYRYQVQGSLQESSRQFLTHRWGPDGEFLARLEKRYQTNLATERRMRLWINPAAPTEAVLFREIDIDGMVPLLGGVGLANALAVLLAVMAFRRRETPGMPSPVTQTAMPVPTPPLPVPSPAPAPRRPVDAPVTPAPRGPADRGAAPAVPPVAAHRRIAVLQAEGGWCADLKVDTREAEGIESATLERLDTKGILRWQDALRINVLSSKPFWYVRCPLPSTGPAIDQARAQPQDVWQVTFRVRTPSGVQRWSEPLSDHWWR